MADSSVKLTLGFAPLASAVQSAVETTMGQVGDEAKRRAIELCPVGPDHRDGSSHLYEEIDASVEKHPGLVSMTLEADKEYAIFVVLGTSKTRAQDFIRPPIDQVASEIPGRLAGNLGGLR